MGKNTTPDKDETSVKANDFQVIKYYLDQIFARIEFLSKKLRQRCEMNSLHRSMRQLTASFECLIENNGGHDVTPTSELEDSPEQ